MEEKLVDTKGSGDGKERKSRPPIIQIIGIIVGLCILAAPIVLNVAEQMTSQQIISSMTDVADNTSDSERLAVLAQAQAYNAQLAGEPVDDSVGSILPYSQQLDWNDESAIAWLEIPTLSLKLPVYRTTGVEALSAGIGHLEGTSLPVGGKSTHCVLSGHSGMYNNQMFDDLREMQVGDLFAVHTLGDELVYEVESVTVVLPEEVSSLEIQQGRDLCTLVTCTPYGVNDHRLLVTGHRTDKQLERKPVAQELLSYVTNMRVLPFVVGIIIVLLGVTVYAVLRHRKRKKVV